MPNPIDNDDTGPYEYDGPVCYYCGEPVPRNPDFLTADEYCSALCAAMADRDNREDR